MSPFRSLLAAALGGTMYFLGYLGYGLWPLLWFFLLPFWWALDRASDQGVRSSMSIGFVFGAVSFAGGHLWLFELVDVFLSGDLTLGLGVWLAYGFAFATGFAMYGAVFCVLRRRGLGLAVAAIAPWIILEWIQPWPFPVYAGAALVDVSSLVQIADLGGTLLLSTLICLVNLAGYETARWSAHRREMPRAVWFFGGAALIATLAYGEIKTHVIAREIEAAPSMRVGVIQANLALLEKRMQAIVSHRRHVELTESMLAEGGPVDLVIWPETAYTRALRGPLPVSGRLVQQGIAVPLLFGATLLDRSGPSPIQFNSALLVGPDGMIRDAYRKNFLIPIAESIPFSTILPSLLERLPHAQHFDASTETPPLRLHDWRIATPICYEAVRPDFVRKMVKFSDANLLVTLANDAWFGSSQEPRLHFQLARMRAIEHRLFLVRATNSGMSAIIDPTGRVVAQTGALERAYLRGVVYQLRGDSQYSRLGDWPGPFSVLCVVAVWWIPTRKSRSR